MSGSLTSLSFIFVKSLNFLTMKEVLEKLVTRKRVLKQKVDKEKFRPDGTRKKRVVRETEYSQDSPSSTEKA